MLTKKNQNAALKTACYSGLQKYFKIGLHNMDIGSITEFKIDKKDFIDFKWLIDTFKLSCALSYDDVVWKWEYDKHNNKILEVRPDGSTWKWEYDKHNNLVRFVKPDGVAWSCEYEYDKHNNKIKEIHDNGIIHEYEYDSNGNLVGVSNMEEDVIVTITTSS